MKILFFMPIDIYKNWPLVNDTTRYHQIIPGCAFPQLAATVPEYECKIFDGLAHSLRGEINKDKFSKMIKNFDLIGINIVSEFIALNTEINIKLIKKIKPSIKIVLGGYHPTFFSQQWCKKGANFVVRHEGEKTFRELIIKLDRKESLEDIKGLTYIENDKIIINADRPLEPSLDVFPIPNYNLIDYTLYRIKICPDGYSGCVEISRGCPYKCNFCWDGPMWKNKQRYKSVNRIIEELKIVLAKGVKWIWFADNNFGSNYERDKLLCEEIVKKNLKFSWGAFMRADRSLLYPDLIKAAKTAGLKHVCVGYETTNSEMLQKTKKGYTNFSFEEYKQSYKTFNKEGIFVIGLFLTGIPGENVNWDFNASQKICDFGTWNSLRPQYKTAIYKELTKEAPNNIKNMFYHNRYQPYRKSKHKMKSAFMYNLKSILNFTTLKKIFFGKNYENLYVRGITSAMMKNALSITPQKLMDFFILHNPFLNLDERQKKIQNKYLNEKIVKKWWGNL